MPYLQSLSTEMPYPNSEKSTNLWPHTSNFAKSHEVLKWVGLHMVPNWVSYVAKSHEMLQGISNF